MNHNIDNTRLPVEYILGAKALESRDVPCLVLVLRSLNSTNSVPAASFESVKSPHNIAVCSCLPLRPKCVVILSRIELINACGLPENKKTKETLNARHFIIFFKEAL